MPRSFVGGALAAMVALASPLYAEQQTISPAEAVLAAVEEPALADLAREALERNPALAASRARARAVEKRAPQVAALPDPVAGLTAFLLSPETRVGPQQVMVSLGQRFPWFGKLDLRERSALQAAATARAEAETQALELVTEVRSLAYELAFLDVWEEVLRTDHETLERYEELARTRYAAGIGLGQAVIKIQAEITKDDSRLLMIADRRATVSARLNALRDRPAGTELPELDLPEPPADLDPDAALADLRRLAVEARPEIAARDAEIARLEHRPDVTVGLSYTVVGDREDDAGRANPPEGNGDDILGLSASINLPIWSQRIDAGIEEAVERRRAAEASRRGVVAEIERSLGELTERLELTWRQLRLLDDVLAIQAEESLSSAEAAYGAGNLNALDLLDAERVLLDVRTSTARTRADWAVALARLEGAVGRPVDLTPSEPAEMELPEVAPDTRMSPDEMDDGKKKDEMDGMEGVAQ